MKKTFRHFEFFYLAQVSSEQLGMEPVFCPHCQKMEFPVIDDIGCLTVHHASTYEQAKKMADDELEKKYPSSKGWRVTMIDEQQWRQAMAAPVEGTEDDQR